MATVNGTPDNDSLVGTNANDLLQGFAGDDTLRGLDGEDTLKGGPGNDLLDGGANIPGAQYDYADYSDASGPVTAVMNQGATPGTATGAGVGTDTLLNIEGFIGSAFADSLTGNGEDNFFILGNGSNTIDGAGGFDIVSYGGDGGGLSVDFNLIDSQGRVSVNRFSGFVDKLTSIEGLLATNFADTLIGGSGNDFLRGRKGDDFIDGGAGVDLADYRNADGPVVVDLSLGHAWGADGYDTLVNIENVRGGAFNDLLIGDAGPNLLRGREGHDLIRGGDGQDTLVGGLGNDTLDGGANSLWFKLDFADYSFEHDPGGVVVNLTTGVATGPGIGTDVLIDIEGVFGTSSNDHLIGKPGRIVLLRGGLGDDTLDGGGSNSAIADYRFPATTDPVQVNLATGIATGAHGTDQLIGIRNVYGGGGADTLTGDVQGNVFRGGGGNDTIDGGAGRDTADYSDAPSAVTVNLATQTATGGDGNDTLISIENAFGSRWNDTLIGDGGDNILRGREGDDTLNGGGGSDTADYQTAESSVTVDLVAQTATSAHHGNDTLISIENATGGEFADTLIGNAIANVLRGEGGDDTLLGGGGDDTLEGGEGDDSLDGGAGIDTAVYAFPFARALLIGTPERLLVADTEGEGGLDVLVGIEKLQFSDRSGDVDDLLAGHDTLYQFYNTVTKQTVYTASYTERATWSSDATLSKGVPGGLPGGEFAAPLEDANTVPVWRFKAPDGVYFWTSDPEMKALLQGAFPTMAYEGVAFNAYGAAGAGRTEIVALWNNTGANLSSSFGNFTFTDKASAQAMADASPVDSIVLLSSAVDPVLTGSFWL